MPYAGNINNQGTVAQTTAMDQAYGGRTAVPSRRPSRQDGTGQGEVLSSSYVGRIPPLQDLPAGRLFYFVDDDGRTAVASRHPSSQDGAGQERFYLPSIGTDHQYKNSPALEGLHLVKPGWSGSERGFFFNFCGQIPTTK